jgi:apolipoprotein N-acyltransferase
MRYRGLVWLTIGAVLLLFSNGKWIVPIAAWIAPIFLLRFVRNERPLRGLLTGLLAVNLVSVVAWRGLIPAPGLIYFVVVSSVSSFLFLPYVIDRLVSPRIGGFKSILVFPTAAASIEYIYSALSPWGTWCTIPYSQSGALPLLQLLSVTGMWGITFLIYWLASTVNFAWERRFDWRDTKRYSLRYIAVLVFVLGFGGVRINLFPPSSPVVRVASLGRSPDESTTVYEGYVSRIASSSDPAKSTVSDEDLDRFLRASMKGIQDALFYAGTQEAQAGADIIVWAENSAPALKQDPMGVVSEEQIIGRGKQFASRESVYLGMSLQVVHNPKILLDNRFIMIDPSGAIVIDYYKAHPIYPSESAVTLNRSTEVPVAPTPYGNLSAVICHDMDFHGLLQQPGPSSADILFDPSADWRDIDPLHTQMAKFRAIEQGFSMVRHTYGGLSLSTDYHGNILAMTDHYDNTDSRMVSYVPTKGAVTVYSKIGDLFAWLCIGMLVFFAIAAMFGKAGDLRTW